MGVPGIWQHREQYMAAMFGFSQIQAGKPGKSG